MRITRGSAMHDKHDESVAAKRQLSSPSSGLALGSRQANLKTFDFPASVLASPFCAMYRPFESNYSRSGTYSNEVVYERFFLLVRNGMADDEQIELCVAVSELQHIL